MKSPALLLLLVALPAVSSLSAPDARASGRERLMARYRAIEAHLGGESSPLPFAVDTRDGRGDAQGDIFAVFDHDFGMLSRALGRAANWCDITPLHLNVKSCTYREEQGRTLLTLYSGRKVYQRPEDVHVLRYEFRVADAQEDYFRVLLTAEEGPLDTWDYVLELEAMPLGAGATFVHMRYAYRYGFGMRVVLASYFATLGSGKVGFSVVGADAAGDPIYVDGFEGLIERNSVRYQLAIQAYLDTLEVPEGQRFERRIARWFDLTERFRPQLFELELEEYLRNKRRERSDQLRLQQALTAETRPGTVLPIAFSQGRN
jgi:hypothetical protein